MATIPRVGRVDSTIAFLREGYTFVSSRCARHQTDHFRTRLMLRDVICMRGAEAAAAFYHPDRFTRKGAMPPTTLTLLQDIGSVQLLDGDAHRHRKALFLSLLYPEPARRLLVDQFATRWSARIGAWENAEEIVFHDEIRRVLCEAICAWAGVPLSPEDADRRTDEFGAMIDGAGSAGPRNWRAQLLRARSERWARDLIESVRSGSLAVPDDAPLARIAMHRDETGEALPTESAAVELINVLRPTVAVARFIVFAALALHDYPGCRDRLATATERAQFAQEVRRFYPFFPVIGGRARQPFTWRGNRIAEGTWVLLDLYGTNHDPNLWGDPDAFRPERFENRPAADDDLVAQGAGRHAETHRCPGEWATIDLIAESARLLTTAMRYEVPPQHLHVDLKKLPALPESGFIMANIRRA